MSRWTSRFGMQGCWYAEGFINLEFYQLKEEGVSQEDHAFRMLKKWALREDATYGQLYQTLKTVYFNTIYIKPCMFMKAALVASYT